MFSVHRPYLFRYHEISMASELVHSMLLMDMLVCTMSFSSAHIVSIILTTLLTLTMMMAAVKRRFNPATQRLKARNVV